MKKIRTFCALFSVAVLASCAGNRTGIEGQWTQPVPGLPEMTQGFILEEGGQASSVNMATLRYNTWKRSGDTLILSGESIGNHQTLDFTDTLIIRKLTPDSLVLNRNGYISRFARTAGTIHNPHSSNL